MYLVQIILGMIIVASLSFTKLYMDAIRLPLERANTLIENNKEIETKIRSAVQMSCDAGTRPAHFATIAQYLPVGFEFKNAISNAYIDNITYNATGSTFTITSSWDDHDGERLSTFYRRHADSQHQLGIASCSGTLCSREIMLERVCP